MSDASDLDLEQLQWGRPVGIMTITCSNCGRTDQVGEGTAPIIDIVRSARAVGWVVVPAEEDRQPGVINCCPRCVDAV